MKNRDINAELRQKKNKQWRDAIQMHYQPIKSNNFQLNDPGQSFLEFIGMENNLPNEQGTGRYKFHQINQIEYIFITKQIKQNPPLYISKFIGTFIEKYLRIKVKKSKLIFKLKDKKIIDEKKLLEFQIKVRNNKMDVYDLLDLLMEYKTDKKILIAFIDFKLQEEGSEVDGRACGDGVAVISLSSINLKLISDLQPFLQTVIHQILHTLGFDHCLSWKCLMNGYTEFQTWLCPICLQKLFYQLEIDSFQNFIIWFSEIIELLNKINSKNTKESIKKGNNIIKSLREIQQK